MYLEAVVSSLQRAVGDLARRTRALEVREFTSGGASPSVVPSPSGTVAAETAYGIVSGHGSAATYSRGDHTHGTPALPTPGDIGAATSAHTHDHGTNTGLGDDDHAIYLLASGARAGAASAAQKFGGATDYAQIATDGTITLHGAATVWDDLRTSGSMVRAGNTSPTFGAFGPSGSLRVLRFDSGQHDEVHFEIQMPHDWLIGSKIYPHVHWTPVDATAGNVVWELEYSWASDGVAFGAPGNMASAATAAGGVAWVHKRTPLLESGNAYIDGTGQTLSSMLVCRLHRNAGSGSDTLAADVAFLEFDIHYEKDALGSSQETVK